MLAQLDRGRLRYELNLTGLDAEDAKITDVRVAVGNGVSQKAETRGVLDMTLPDGAEFQNYILTVQAHAVQKNQKGETVETNVDFSFVLRLESGIDLDLQLTWQPTGQATCPANGSVNPHGQERHADRRKFRIRADNSSAKVRMTRHPHGGILGDGW